MLESWLQRCNRKPWRMFLLAWLLLCMMLGAAGLGRWRYDTADDLMPPPEAVNYSAYLPKRVQRFKFQIDVDDPSTLPAYDMLIAAQVWPTGMRAFSQPRVTPPGEGIDHPRLIMDRPLLEAAYGWPLTLTRWRSFRAWDVTDPFAKEFEHAPHVWGSYLNFGGTTVGYAIALDDASRVIEGGVSLAAIAFDLLALQIIAAFLVWLSWKFVQRRTRKRIACGLCLCCGHNLGPPPRSQKCPECGEDTSTIPPPLQPAFAGRAFIIGLAIVLLITLIMHSVSWRTDEIEDRTEQVLEQGRVMAKNSRIKRYVSSQIASGNIGFIDPFLTYSHSMWYTCAPGAEPIGVAPPRLSTGLAFSVGNDQPELLLVNRGTGSVWSFTIPWKWIAIQLAVLEMIALLLMMVCVVVRITVRITRRQAVRASS